MACNRWTQWTFKTLGFPLRKEKVEKAFPNRFSVWLWYWFLSTIQCEMIHKRKEKAWKNINDQVLTTKLCFCSGGVSDSQNQWVKEVLKMEHFETYPGGPGVGQGMRKHQSKKSPWYHVRTLNFNHFRLRHQNQAFLLPPRHPFCLKDLEIHLEALLHGITHLFQLAGIPRMVLSDASNMGQLRNMQHQKLVRATNSTNKTSESITVSCSN